jgi:acyl-CoA synthetase (AMP-forming)/AMP-acid ligase II
MPVFETKCIDQGGKDVGPGEIGELCVRGAQVIRGYLNRPEATAEAIQDGWLRTGDIARIDEDGFIFIVDRAKDMVLRGGENVYCADIEATIASHAAVLECAVFGVEDERLGEEVAAAVYADPKSELSAEALRAFCAENLANYKIPRYLWLLDEPLPRNASGKFLKKQLRADLDPADAE